MYCIPWGDIGSYDNTAGAGYSDQAVHLGAYDATEPKLAAFESQETNVGTVDRLSE